VIMARTLEMAAPLEEVTSQCSKFGNEVVTLIECIRGGLLNLPATS